MQTDMVEAIVKRHGPTSVRAHQFFVAWNSVATLAYEGFSRTLLEVKEELNEGLPGLKPENPGSKWPKTTLGCLAEGKSLTEQQVYQLRDICQQKTEQLRQLPESDRIMAIDELQFVTFYCRTLEHRLGVQRLPLAGEQMADDYPSKSHLAEVSETMDKFGKDQHDKYFLRLAPEGRTIDSYYRAPHIESTLVCELQPSEGLQAVVMDFEDTVDKAFPNSYAWFEPASWHMTVRALLTVQKQ